MKKGKGALLLAIIISLALGLPVLPASAPSIIYVDDDAEGENDGTSWEDAYTDLQSALASAMAGDEIWVAAGIYKPGSSRYDTFQLVDGVALYGGFASTETDREQRDWVANPTVLSGDIGNGGDSSDNSYHVVTSQGTNSTILDGFIVIDGNANGDHPNNTSGGGIHNYYGELTVNNCIIYGNTAAFRGGGLFNSGGTVTMNWVIISNNTSTGNTGGWATGGGGIEVSGISWLAPTTVINLINCIVNGNTATAEGYDNNNNKWREGHGGGIRVGGPNTAVNISNSSIVNNEAQEVGGGIRAAGTSTIKNSILWGNTAPIGAQFSGFPTISYSLVLGGYAGPGNINANPQFVDADGPDDIVGTLDDNLRLKCNSPAVDAGNNSDVSSNFDLDGNSRIVDGNGDGVATVDMGAYELITPQLATQLIEQVGDLVIYAGLNSGQGNSLIVKLEAALHQMYRGQNNTAINQLGAFINQVEAFMKVGTLSEDDGQELIDSANEIIDAL